jgi:hypothetical protein
MDESTKLEERIRNRVRHRWRRRARIVAPFAALPLLLGTLLLSVDIIEYSPQPPRVALTSSRPTPQPAARIRPSLAARSAIATSALVKNEFLARDETVETDPNEARLESERVEELDEDVPPSPMAYPTRVGGVAP